ncbi:hypothetical protein DSL72_000177 [Monilinia vaccinii-corymbosi]|uniref:Flavin reductase like domain-containing protein n=1 Tax=Monilinia vaccinii-corymbosi TaxID=61207 RepID=A0A8A3P299_9HELO|nr:hypothetical protein DSL72_000177 [Monilinia vaccinii-corymbosi]
MLIRQADIPLDSSSETIPNSNVGQADTPIDSPSEASDESPKLESLSDEVRKVMRHVPYPVVVLTTPHLRLTPEGHPTRLAGMTLSSFNTLSLSPDPIITFNIKRPSPTLDALKSTQDPDIISVAPSERERRFHIHILQANTAGLKIAHQFSRGGPISDEDLAMVSRSRVGSKSWPYPMAKGVRRVFECEVLQEAKGSFIDVNDHTLVIGRVKKIVEKTRTSVVKEIEWSGLCYMHGSYHTADCLVNQDVKGKEQRLEVKEDGENLEGSMLEEGKKADS